MPTQAPPDAGQLTEFHVLDDPLGPIDQFLTDEEREFNTRVDRLVDGGMGILHAISHAGREMTDRRNAQLLEDRAREYEGRLGATQDTSITF